MAQTRVMAMVMLVTVNMLSREAAALTSAPPAPPPTTYSPAWDTTAHPAPLAATTQETVLPAGDHQRGASDTGGASVPLETVLSEGDIARADGAVLRLEMYQGRPTLVYRLAPGAIFAGVRSPPSPTQHDREWRGSSGASEPARKHSGGAAGKLRKPMTPARQPPERGVPAAIASPSLTAHSLKQQHLAPRRPPYHGLSLSGLRATLATLSTAGIGAVRGFRLIFMLLQYLGFLPHVPGLPKYEDPALLRPSTHYTLPRGDAALP